MKTQDRAKELAAAHWGYIEKLLEAHGYSGDSKDIIGFHYRTAMEHGHGHGVEDERNGMFWEDTVADEYINHVALEAELDRSCGDAAADAEHANRAKIVFTMGCPTCLDAAACSKTMHTDRTGRCLYHRLKPSEKAERKASLCHSCHAKVCSKERITACEESGTCAFHISTLRENMLDAKQEAIAAGLVGANCTTEVCRHYSPMFMRNCPQYSSSAISGCAYYRPEWEETKQEAPTAAVLPLDFTLPSIALKCTAEEAVEKFLSEMDEWGAAKEGSLHELVEKWDCLQALYTAYQRGADVDWYQDNVRTVMAYLTEYAAEGRDVMKARRGMLLKNAKRPNPEGGTGYYSPEVCAAIIASGGNSWK